MENIFNFNDYLIGESDENIKNRIVALASKTVKNGATLAEEESSKNKIKELITKYKLTRNDLVSYLDDENLNLFFKETQNKGEFFDVIDGAGKHFNIRKIKMVNGKTFNDTMEVYIYDPKNLYDKFINSKFYSFMTYDNSAISRTTDKRFNSIHISWFKPNNNGALSTIFYDKEDAIGCCALYYHNYQIKIGEFFMNKNVKENVLFLIDIKTAYREYIY
jgi:hypothetical protein